MTVITGFTDYNETRTTVLDRTSQATQHGVICSLLELRSAFHSDVQGGPEGESARWRDKVGPDQCSLEGQGSAYACGQNPTFSLPEHLQQSDRPSQRMKESLISTVESSLISFPWLSAIGTRPPSSPRMGRKNEAISLRTTTTTNERKICIASRISLTFSSLSFVRS